MKRLMLILLSLLALLGVGLVAPSAGADTAVKTKAAVTARDLGKKVEIDNGIVLTVPHADGRVVADFVHRNPDGTVKLMIPKGFSIDQVPNKMSDITAASVGATNVGSPVPSHDTYYAHWAGYRWAGVKGGPERNLWLLDRTVYGEEWTVVRAAVENNGTIAPGLEARGISPASSPGISYYDDDGQDGNCPRGVWTGYTNWSFVTACTSFNIGYHCTNSDAAGCAWVHHGSIHYGPSYQPTMWIRSHLPDGAQRATVTYHELGHTLGWGHNMSEAHSLMYPSVGWDYKGPTNHDLWDLSDRYRHPVE